jgi:small neutral amino acid transporter SnatA (MarC family)
VITVVALLVAVDPIGLARVWPGRFDIGLYVGAALGAAVLLADPVLDLLDLSPEGFWIAAGIVLLVPAFSRLGRGATRDVAGPAGVLVTMALATRDGTGITVVAAIVTALAVVAAMAVVRGENRWWTAVERVIGALMVVLALDLVRDGVIAV